MQAIQQPLPLPTQNASNLQIGAFVLSPNGPACLLDTRAHVHDANGNNFTLTLRVLTTNDDIILPTRRVNPFQIIPVTKHVYHLISITNNLCTLMPVGAEGSIQLALPTSVGYAPMCQAILQLYKEPPGKLLVTVLRFPHNGTYASVITGCEHDPSQ